MFDNLSERLGRTVKNLRGQGRLTEDNIKDTLREIRMALLEARQALWQQRSALMGPARTWRSTPNE